MIRSLLVFLLTLSPSFAAEPVPERTIVIIGDSLTEGYGVPKEAAYPTLVEKKLRADGLSVRIINAGISGSTTASGLERLNWQLKNKPDILMIALGANDGLRGVSEEVDGKNLEAMIVTAKKSVPRIVLAEMKLPPNYGKKEAAEFEGIYRRLAKTSGDASPFFLAGVAGDASLNQADGIHPNEKGHGLVAEAIGKALRRELEKLEDPGAAKKYRQGNNEIPVLRGIDLELPAGKSAAILGKSGSGKTTLLSILAGLEPADAGSVYWDETEILKLSEDALNPLRSRKVGIVFQQFHLIPYLTAVENVELPTLWQNRTDLKVTAREWLRRVGLEDRADHFPSELSGGEKQRVAIARALVNSPGLVLADEPVETSMGNRARVMDLLFDQCTQAGSSLILVTHDQDLARRCDRVLTLEHGQFR